MQVQHILGVNHNLLSRLPSILLANLLIYTGNASCMVQYHAFVRVLDMFACLCKYGMLTVCIWQTRHAQACRPTLGCCSLVSVCVANACCCPILTQDMTPVFPCYFTLPMCPHRIEPQATVLMHWCIHGIDYAGKNRRVILLQVNCCSLDGQMLPDVSSLANDVCI